MVCVGQGSDVRYTIVVANPYTFTRDRGSVDELGSLILNMVLTMLGGLFNRSDSKKVFVYREQGNGIFIRHTRIVYRDKEVPAGEVDDRVAGLRVRIKKGDFD